MNYNVEQRTPDEQIHPKPEQLWTETVWMLIAGVVLLACILALSSLVSTWAAPKIPFAFEQTLSRVLNLNPQTADTATLNAQQSVQALANELHQAMGMPAHMPVVIHLNPDPIDNAYATLGGHIVLYAGLLKRLRTQAELSALLAHEMAHIKYRHVASSMGRALTLTFVTSLVSADLAHYFANLVLTTDSLLTASYSREQESLCDAQALQALQKRYGNVAGARDLMHVIHTLSTQQASKVTNTLFHTHPQSHERQAAVERWAQQYPPILTLHSQDGLPSALIQYLAQLKP